MVDGMRINTNGVMSRTTALGTLTNMNSIDHIEILKGAASTLYGSDAQSMVSITKVAAMVFSGQ